MLTMNHFRSIGCRNSQRLVPFRESKLTQLFRNYLIGKGRARMTVNVSRCASAFDETSHVLKFSAVARKVSHVPIVSKIDTGLGLAGSTMRSDLENMLESDIEDLQGYNRALVEKIQQLQAQVVDMETRFVNLETEVREEVAAEVRRQVKIS